MGPPTPRAIHGLMRSLENSPQRRNIVPGISVDPFAGQGDMLTLCESELGMDTHGYDIQEELGWEINDSLVSVPRMAAAICITNPPYLANYSARRKSMWPMVGEYFEDSGRSDLYEIALDKCLGSYDHVVAIIPETFIHSTYPKDRCHSIVILEETPSRIQLSQFVSLAGFRYPGRTLRFT